MNEELTGLRDEMRQGFAEMRHGFVRVDQRLDRLDLDVADCARASQGSART